MNWRGWFHIHSDPNWKLWNVHRYYECRCGARRVVRAYSNMDGVIMEGWPDLVDSHGQPRLDSGWVTS